MTNETGVCDANQNVVDAKGAFEEASSPSSPRVLSSSEKVLNWIILLQGESFVTSFCYEGS